MVSDESLLARRSLMRRLQRKHYKKKSEQNTRLQVWLSRDLARSIRLASAAASMTVGEWVTSVVTERLEKQP